MHETDPPTQNANIHIGKPQSVPPLEPLEASDPKAALEIDSTVVSTVSKLRPWPGRASNPNWNNHPQFA